MHCEHDGVSSSVSDARSEVVTETEVDKIFSTHQTLMVGTQMIPETSVIFN